jgi:hypothetical protein
MPPLWLKLIQQKKSRGSAGVLPPLNRNFDAPPLLIISTRHDSRTST